MAKKIINGWRFDTETATALGEATNFGAGASSILDFDYWSEVLYVTKQTRRYFLACEGQALSRYAKPCGGGMGYGSDIKPLSEREAFSWAADNLGADEVQALFPEFVCEA